MVRGTGREEKEKKGKRGTGKTEKVMERLTRMCSWLAKAGPGYIDGTVATYFESLKFTLHSKLVTYGLRTSSNSKSSVGVPVLWSAQPRSVPALCTTTCTAHPNAISNNMKQLFLIMTLF